jgi:hypothetical protein
MDYNTNSLRAKTRTVNLVPGEIVVLQAPVPTMPALRSRAS